MESQWEGQHAAAVRAWAQSHMRGPSCTPLPPGLLPEACREREAAPSWRPGPCFHFAATAVTRFPATNRKRKGESIDGVAYTSAAINQSSEQFDDTSWQLSPISLCAGSLILYCVVGYGSACFEGSALACCSTYQVLFIVFFLLFIWFLFSFCCLLPSYFFLIPTSLRPCFFFLFIFNLCFNNYFIDIPSCFPYSLLLSSSQYLFIIALKEFTFSLFFYVFIYF